MRMMALVLVLGGLSATASCGPPAPDAGRSARAVGDTLMGVLTDAYDFSRPDVAERMGSLYPDGRVISASNGQVTTSADTLRAGLARFWTNVGRNMREPKWVWGAAHVDRLGRDAVVLTAEWTLPHIAPDGRPHVLAGAWTAVFRRIDGEWKIVQEHLSD